MSKTICITGGAGFIGSHLADAFLADGHRVIILDDFSSGREENVPEGAELHRLDIRSPEAAEVVANSEADTLYHQAAQIDVRRSVEDPAFDAEVNVVGSLRLFEAARRGGVGQIVFASTGGAIYGEQDVFPADEEHPTRPLSPYGAAKQSVERYLYFYNQVYGLDVTCLRYANVYGERQNPHGEAGVVAIFLDRLLTERTPRINGDGLQTRDYVHVSDVVRANKAVLGQSGFQVFNVGTGRETTVVELFDQLVSSLGLDIRAEHAPAKAGEQRRSVIDPGKIQRRLGVPEPLPLADGFDRTAAWFRDRYQRQA